LISHQSLLYEDAEQIVLNLSIEQQEAMVEEALSRLRFFDNPIDELQHITYTMELKISEANWHQLLRHNRRTHFSYGKPTIFLGYTTPINIKKAALTEKYHSFMEKVADIYEAMANWNPQIAQYLVTNAHHRQITATASLWELYHLINLRTSPEAQWDIRLTFEQLYTELKQKHPALARYAQRRITL
jgi:thymidylate synthase ThyX